MAFFIYMKRDKPIGIFDSGVGGLTVLKELVTLLPNENFIYYADSANCPYGTKSYDEIIELTKKITDFLLSNSCKMIVVACNTATAAAIDILRKNYKLPFVGMEPAVKPAAETTKTGKIGILATAGTFEGRLFKQTSKVFADDVDKIVQVGEGLVELVENDNYESEEAKELLSKYILPMVAASVDKIVLGCTHYPFFSDIIQTLTPNTVEVINPAPAVAKRVQYLLEELSLGQIDTESGRITFYTSGSINALERLAKKLFVNRNMSFNEV